MRHAGAKRVTVSDWIVTACDSRGSQAGGSYKTASRRLRGQLPTHLTMAEDKQTKVHGIDVAQLIQESHDPDTPHKHKKGE